VDDPGVGKVAENELTDRIRSAGLRVTRPRLLVLGLLNDMGGHRSADELLDALDRRGATLPRASVYNVLNDLVRSGVVMLADAGPGRALYEVAAQWHHHFVCRKCGAILDMPCAVGSKPCLDAELEGAQIDEAQVIFRGLCPACYSVN
jgi:Fe2+ or Zn2+ uptake regulation protein